MMRFLLIVILIGFVSADARSQESDEDLVAKFKQHLAEDQAAQKEIDRGEYEKARRIWRDAAKRGNPFAKLGLCIYNSPGDSSSDPFRKIEEAVHYCTELSIKGLPTAQYFLGRLYSSGTGVEKDDTNATFWMKEAAEGNIADAQFILGLRYVTGRGVPRDLVLGYHWLNLAAGQGYEGAAKARDDLRQFLTQQQLEESNRITRDWKPRENESLY